MKTCKTHKEVNKKNAYTQKRKDFIKSDAEMVQMLEFSDRIFK